MDRYIEEWAEERVGGAFLIQLTMRRRSRMCFVEEAEVDGRDENAKHTLML